MSRIKLAAIIFWIGLGSFAIAQPNLNAPFSYYGIGLIKSNSSSYSRGMGGVGISLQSKQFLNTTNPAMISANKYSHFDYGVDWETSRTTTRNGSSSSVNPQLSFINFSFPITRKISTAFGFSPFSRSSYTFEDTKTLNNQQINYLYEGTGGLSKLFWGAGVEVIGDTSRHYQCRIGLEASFLFGKQTKSASSQLIINGVEETLISKFEDVNNYRGVLLKPGITFSKELKRHQLDTMETLQSVQTNATEGRYFIMIAGKNNTHVSDEIKDNAEKTRLYNTYREFKTNLFGIYVKETAQGKSKQELTDDFIETYKRSRQTEDKDSINIINLDYFKEYLRVGRGIHYSLGVYYQYIPSMTSRSLGLITQVRDFDETIVNQDTLSSITNTGINLPISIGFGFGLQKPEVTNSTNNEGQNATWSLGLDVVYTDWNNTTQYITGFKKSTYAIKVGGEIVPDVKGNSRKRLEDEHRFKTYLNRVVYRGGLTFSTLPFSVNNTQVKEFGINFGMSLPLGSLTRSYPKYINLLFGGGQRGAIAANGLKENYFNTTISFSVNEKWFTKRKIGF